MHEEKYTPRFIACKRRNVAAAYERFLGPSAGALEEPWHSRTWSGLKRMLVRRKRAPLAEPSLADVHLTDVHLKESAS